MIVHIIPYFLFGEFKYYQASMTWDRWFMLLTIIIFAAAVLFTITHIILKFYPSISKKTRMSDIHYEASYNQKYLKQPPLFYKLRQMKFWKIIAVVLIIVFVFIRYYRLAFHYISSYWL